MATFSDYEREFHTRHMQYALAEARKSPPMPTNFCVGACLVSMPAELTQGRDNSSSPPTTAGHRTELLATGYTLECEGNTHAEQSCFIKLASKYGCTEDNLGSYLPEGVVLYTTMEPCNKRSAGNLPCVDRILKLKNEHGEQAIKTVYVGVSEPEKFVGVNEGRQKLEDAGVNVIHVPGMEEEILAVATAGHEKQGTGG